MKTTLFLKESSINCESTKKKMMKINSFYKLLLKEERGNFRNKKNAMKILRNNAYLVKVETQI